MLSTKDIAIVYETLLTSPGMNEPVKIAINLPRKNVLLLAKVIELGLANKEGAGEQTIVSVVKKETLGEISALSDELLNKAGLQEMNTKLLHYSSSKSCHYSVVSEQKNSSKLYNCVYKACCY
ncbi:MAG: hypothetical protein M3R72_08915 [Bacteroidota bacterium]|nr:hypothetical protein [Bacteroidota bacterium]